MLVDLLRLGCSGSSVVAKGLRLNAGNVGGATRNARVTGQGEDEDGPTNPDNPQKKLTSRTTEAWQCGALIRNCGSDIPFSC